MTAVQSMRPSNTESFTRTVMIAKSAGFCFGVRRAVDIALAQRPTNADKTASLGPIVHNPRVSADLKRSGIGEVTSLDALSSGDTVIMSAHGVSPQVLKDAGERGLNIVDVTCPFVTKLHRSAMMLAREGYQVLLVGDAGHTEVLGVVGAVESIGGQILVISCLEELEKIALSKRVGVVSQTTQYLHRLAEITAAVCMRASEVRSINTVCGATEELQAAAMEMAQQVDVAIVIGGWKSANTRRLREICAAQGIPAYQVESPEEIQESWLFGKRVVGLTAGASTPDSDIQEAARILRGERVVQQPIIRSA